MTTTGDGRWPTADDAGGPGEAAWRRWLSPEYRPEPDPGEEPQPVDGPPNGVPPNGRATGPKGHPLPPYAAELPPSPLPPAGPPPAALATGGAQSSGTQPSGVRSSGAQPSGTHSSGTQPSGVRPSGAQQGEVQPSGAQQGEVQPSGAQQGEVQPSSAQPPPARPGPDRPDAVRPYPAPPVRRGRHAAPDDEDEPSVMDPALNGHPLAAPPPPVPDWRPEPRFVPRYPEPEDDPTEVFERPADLRASPPPPPGYPPTAVALPYAAPMFAAVSMPESVQAVLPAAPLPTEAPAPGPPSPDLPHPGRAAVRRKRRRRRLLEWPFLIVFSLLAALLLRTWVVQTFYIPSESMHDTLVEGDRVLVNKLAYDFHGLNRGDVIVFRRPPNIDITDEDLIKRVIGLPGEKVEGRDRHVYINGRELQEPYVPAGCGGTANFPAVRVQPGHVFVMGDNRCDSTDSRVFGPIDTDLVVGRAFVIIWPLGRIGWL